jgi:hypothetical protein
MWSMDYVQVPSEEDSTEEVETNKEKKKECVKEENKKETTKKRVHELVKQMSISNEETGKAHHSYTYYHKQLAKNRLKNHII